MKPQRPTIDEILEIINKYDIVSYEPIEINIIYTSDVPTPKEDKIIDSIPSCD